MFLLGGEDAWKVQFGLLLFSVIAATDTIMDTTRKMFTEEPPRESEPSAWVERDFEFAKSYLSRFCVCTTGGLGLTAEFGIREGITNFCAFLALRLHPLLAERRYGGRHKNCHGNQSQFHQFSTHFMAT